MSDKIQLIDNINNLLLSKNQTDSNITGSNQDVGISSTDVQLIQYVIELILKYGIPAFISLMATWNNDKDVSLEDIQNLKTLVKDPEEYFK